MCGHDPAMMVGWSPSCRTVHEAWNCGMWVMSELCAPLQQHILVGGSVLPRTFLIVLRPAAWWGPSSLRPRELSSRHPHPRCTPRKKPFASHLQQPAHFRVSVGLKEIAEDPPTATAMDMWVRDNCRSSKAKCPWIGLRTHRQTQLDTIEQRKNGG